MKTLRLLSAHMSAKSFNTLPSSLETIVIDDPVKMESDDQFGSFFIPSGLKSLKCPINVFKYLNFTKAEKFTKLNLTYPAKGTPNIKVNDPAWNGLPGTLTKLELDVENHSGPVLEITINSKITELDVILRGDSPKFLFVTSKPDQAFPYESDMCNRKISFGLMNNVNGRINFIPEDRCSLEIGCLEQDKAEVQQINGGLWEDETNRRFQEIYGNMLHIVSIPKKRTQKSYEDELEREESERLALLYESYY
ncbi:unnamed protein product [Ambrosiozyma monospora]|uniref:Unnamed protein product n=1 Tax=Ambrosiozyma monospora TaxID=43982 RepID=A0ACB5TEC3_AMBMO|nr:unnamed protein product [Ambrosiozyma monospora]